VGSVFNVGLDKKVVSFDDGGNRDFAFLGYRGVFDVLGASISVATEDSAKKNDHGFQEDDGSTAHNQATGNNVPSSQSKNDGSASKDQHEKENHEPSTYAHSVAALGRWTRRLIFRWATPGTDLFGVSSGLGAVTFAFGGW